MSIKTYREAINEALLQEMKKDENVVVIGEDVAGGAGTNGEQDAWGGVLGVTKGLLKHFGRERIIDTPITEMANCIAELPTNILTTLAIIIPINPINKKPPSLVKSLFVV